MPDGLILGYRIVISVYFILNLIWAMIYFHENIAELALLTNWNIILSTMFYLLITTSAAYNWLKQTNQSESPEVRTIAAIYAEYDEMANSTSNMNIVDNGNHHNGNISNCSKIVWILYESSFGISFLSTLMYWAFTASYYNEENQSKTLITISFHLVNFLLLVIDFTFHTIPVRILHVVYPILFALLYIVVSLAKTGCVVYKNNDPGIVTLFVFLIFLLVICGQLFSYVLYRIKLRFCVMPSS